MPTIRITTDFSGFNNAYKPYVDNTSRYLIFYGSAGSGKSYFIAQRYVDKMLHIPTNLLVIRNTAKSNRDSTFALLTQVIRKNEGISKFFNINRSDLRITTRLSNSEVIFAGLDDVEKLKSITFQNGELTDIWIEEASEIEEADFNQLDIRLRGLIGNKQIVLSFNPVNINHWLKRKFFDNPLPNATILKTTYKDNRFLDKEYIKLLESYKDTDPYYYQVYCLGNWGVLGNTIFDANKINKRIQELKEPLYQGFFSYKYDGLKISDIEFIEDDTGYIKIYELPSKKYQYVIGGDTAGEGSDFFIGNCINNENGNQVAVLRKQFDADEYTRQMYCLGMYYKQALIGIESNFDTFPIMELERLGYRNQYVREQEDTFTNGYKKSYGFKTTSVSRPRIISELVKIVKESIECFNDKDTLEEMLTFVRNDKGRVEAERGCHDDLVMANAITYDIRSQQKPIQFSETKKRKEDSFIKFGR